MTLSYAHLYFITVWLDCINLCCKGIHSLWGKEDRTAFHLTMIMGKRDERWGEERKEREGHVFHYVVNAIIWHASEAREGWGREDGWRNCLAVCLRWLSRLESDRYHVITSGSRKQEAAADDMGRLCGPWSLSVSTLWHLQWLQRLRYCNLLWLLENNSFWAKWDIWGVSLSTPRHLKHFKA